MSDSSQMPPSQPSAQSGASSDHYVVVARRYRPQSFEDLVGQDQVSQALRNAIETGRVGHAYLFTGARGVGKTSSARILAKALNCAEGPTATPCGQCDMCLSIAVGEDVDVLEIDGASNRGIDEIRQLRSNAGVRPSRSRFKIYIIDEVHMLTTPAFNALLKTLEEPPEHVKFLFCTTDPEKIPVTVLSRCQRFDFAPVEADAIVERLQFIVDSENASADREALALLARRAGGSMRDSQSLLEQLLSFCTGTISAADVHAMLGTADSGRLAEIAQRLIARDAAAALLAIDTATSEGVDAGQLAEQLVGYLRDMMAAAVGCGAEMMRFSTVAEFQQLQENGKLWGLQTLLAAIAILDQSITRMRQSAHTQMLLEVAVVRICRLEHLDALGDLIERVNSGEIAAGPVATNSAPPPPAPSQTRPPAAAAAETPQKKSKKNAEAPLDAPSPPAASVELTPQTAGAIWKQALANLEDMTADFAGCYESVALKLPSATSGPKHLAVYFRPQYNLQKDACEKPDRKAKLEEALHKVAGQVVRLEFQLQKDDESAEQPRPPKMSRSQRIREKRKHPLVKQAIELFDADVLDVEEK